MSTGSTAILGMEGFIPRLPVAFGSPPKSKMVAAVDAASFLKLQLDIQDINALKMTGGEFMAQTPKLRPASLKIFGPSKNTLRLIQAAGYMTPTTITVGAIIQITNKDPKAH